VLSKQNFFSELQDREEEFGISDIQLGLTTLEEVFLNIARQAELENATAEGRLITLTLTSGESVQVSVTVFCFIFFYSLKGLSCNWFYKFLIQSEYKYLFIPDHNIQSCRITLLLFSSI